MLQRYNVSKLLEVFYARELAFRIKHYDDAKVIINFVNPELCQSELAREAGWIVQVMKALLARTTEAGSRVLVYGAQAGQETHGQYVSNCRVEL